MIQSPKKSSMAPHGAEDDSSEDIADDYDGTPTTTSPIATTQTNVNQNKTVIASVSTHNTYAVLNDESENEDEHETKLKKMKIQKERIPPISILGKTRSEVINICNELKLKNFYVKITTKGINLYFNNIDEYKEARKFFQVNKFPTFTHDLNSEKQFRVVLKGLFSMEIDELAYELHSNGIKPVDIKNMIVKKRKYDDQANYLLYFNKESTNIMLLNKCKHLFHVRVEFERYCPHKFGPIRCRNCQLWGHGAKNCNLPAACMFCAENHQTNDCKFVVNGVRASGFVAKCANCGGKHSANFENCPSLIQYKELQENITRKNSVKNNRNVRHEVTKNTKIQPIENRYTEKTRTYATVAANGINFSTTNHHQSNESSEKLLSAQEMIKLTREMISIYKQCKTREQQFNAISELAIKYVYGNGP